AYFLKLTISILIEFVQLSVDDSHLLHLSYPYFQLLLATTSPIAVHQIIHFSFLNIYILRIMNI
ncbi:hypothetical protein, partial [Staphylococcus aureus]|uniref:hypothetical protein n=1 Tax=Staphylococcus aureus TaxID=1280 RepID=UPI00301B713D